MWDKSVEKKKILELLNQALVLIMADKMKDAHNRKEIENAIFHAIEATEELTDDDDLEDDDLEDDYMDSYYESYC